MKIPGYDNAVRIAESEGRLAHINDIERRHCPYVPGSFLYRAWMRGYEESFEFVCYAD